MGLIPQKERDILAKEFGEKLVNDVRLVVFTQEMPCLFCKETELVTVLTLHVRVYLFVHSFLPLAFRIQVLC